MYVCMLPLNSTFTISAADNFPSRVAKRSSATKSTSLPTRKNRIEERDTTLYEREKRNCTVRENDLTNGFVDFVLSTNANDDIRNLLRYYNNIFNKYCALLI